jgi:hypothetical protein
LLLLLLLLLLLSSSSSSSLLLLCLRHIIVTIVVRTVHSDSLIHESLKVNSKQIQKNLKLKSDVYITVYSSLLKYRLSKLIIRVSGTLKTEFDFQDLDSNSE